MECPRCAADIADSAHYCAECGHNVETHQASSEQSTRISQESQANDHGNNPEANTSEHSEQSKNQTTAQNSGANTQREPHDHKPEPATTEEGQRNSEPASRKQSSRKSPQEVASTPSNHHSGNTSGLLTRRRLIAGGVIAAAGIGVAKAGIFNSLFGGGTTWPTYPEATRVQLNQPVTERVQSRVGLQTDVTLRAYTTTNSVEEVRTWYADQSSINGWQVEQSYGYGVILRRNDQGIWILVQSRDQLIDLGLPSESPQPTDILLIRGPWNTINQ